MQVKIHAEPVDAKDEKSKEPDKYEIEEAFRSILRAEQAMGDDRLRPHLKKMAAEHKGVLAKIEALEASALPQTIDEIGKKKKPA